MLRIGILYLVIIFLAGCSCSVDEDQTNSRYILNMKKQTHIKAQEGDASGHILMRIPPEGTRARNRTYYPYKDQVLKAEQNLKNPLPFNQDVLEQGKKYYTQFCIYCHGTKGDAKEGANVAGKMIVAPPSLLTDKVARYKEGRLYHIIYSGQGLMGPYRVQLETKEQVLVDYMNKKRKYIGSPSIWAVVHYVRFLRKQSQFEERMGQ